MREGLRRYPLSARLQVAAAGGRRAGRVRMLAGAADWRRVLLDGLGAVAIAAAGTRPWRPSESWVWPAIGPEELTAELARDIPGCSISAAVLPRQPGRPRLSLLVDAGGSAIVVKLGPVGRDIESGIVSGIENEARALRALTRDPLPCIATPRVVAAGTVGGGSVAFVATDALALGGQRPAIGERLTTFERDLAERLGDQPRPDGFDDDAVPVHGDLAPWNLRRTSRGLALFDWEACGWGPPGSDLAHYRRSCAGLTTR